MTGSPDWAPDGRTYAYEHYGRIYVGRRGQGPAAPVTDDNLSDGDPSFSGPEGKRIVYDHYDDAGNLDIWLMRADGSNQRRLTHSKGFDPSFSPDGDLIVFEHNSHLYSIRPDGTHSHQIARAHHGPVEEASFSPDGKSIVFVARTRTDDRIATTRLSGGGIHYVTPVDEEAHTPVFSPNGKLIAYAAFRADHRKKKSIFAVKTDGTGRRVLVRSHVNVYDGLSWARR